MHFFEFFQTFCWRTMNVGGCDLSSFTPEELQALSVPLTEWAALGVGHWCEVFASKGQFQVWSKRRLMMHRNMGVHISCPNTWFSSWQFEKELLLSGFVDGGLISILPHLWENFATYERSCLAQLCHLPLADHKWNERDVGTEGLKETLGSLKHIWRSINLL